MECETKGCGNTLMTAEEKSSGVCSTCTFLVTADEGGDRFDDLANAR